MVAPPPQIRICLSEAVDQFLDHATGLVSVGRRSKRTAEIWSADLRDFEKITGRDVVVDDITGDDIDSAVLAFSRIPDRRCKNPTVGKSAAAQLRFTKSLKAFFKHGLTHGWVQHSPIGYAEMLPDERSIPPLRTARTALSGAQAQALLDYGPGTPSTQTNKRTHDSLFARNKLILNLLTILGPRVSELAAADIADIRPETDLDGNTQHWWRIIGKGRKLRTVPLSAWLMSCVEDYLAVRPTPANADAAKALLPPAHTV